MIYLLLSILSSSLIYVVFKLLDKFNIRVPYAIVVNYLTAVVAGYLGHSKSFNVETITSASWFWGALVLGVLFITVFNLMALTTKINGLSAVSVASKMSLSIPIVFVIFYYNESASALKIIAIVLALIAVYLASVKDKKGISLQKGSIIFPVLVFFGSGIIETGIKFLEQNYVAKDDVALFSMTLFVFASIIGIVVSLYLLLVKKIKFTYKELLGGIALGIPNYYSVYFFIQALRGDLDSATVFLINNVAIVMLSTLLGIVLFKEKILRKNWIGIALAVVSLILVALTTQ
ncbi:EamA/RhaT family transporter [Mesonia sp. MT50]|uniref:EamA/RhaT family transporter n=1 Tax=Mesonia profundi TaxID=3070998 RepID=A0ABU1A114_9FLAO|nr:EamA/RhaT family transporter [Mesonia profundi]MDQ7916406.1 EamA/RhaT family transporter [Mesonia profundi]